MTKLTIELSVEDYERLRQRAEHVGTSPEVLSRELLAAALDGSTAGDQQPTTPADEPPPPQTEREATHAILVAAGLVRPRSPLSSELQALVDSFGSPEERQAAFEEARAAFARAGGPSASEILLEQRGPKG